jgi:hypothetical protein
VLCLTHSMDIVNGTMLALLGLTVSTTVGATLVDRPTGADGAFDSTFETGVRGLIAPADPAAAAAAASVAAQCFAAGRQSMRITNGLVTDLLSETSPRDWDPHRAQVLLFSGIFGIYYIFQLNRMLALPSFSADVLTLLGISGATYLGFKVVKNQT